MARYLVMFGVTVDTDDPLSAYDEARNRVSSEDVDAHVWTVPEDIDTDAVVYVVRNGAISDTE